MNSKLHKDILSDDVSARRNFLLQFATQPEIEYLLSRIADEIVVYDETTPDEQFITPCFEETDEDMILKDLFYRVAEKEELLDRDNGFKRAKEHIIWFLTTGELRPYLVTDSKNYITEEWNTGTGYYISYLEKLVRPFNMLRIIENAFVVKHFEDEHQGSKIIVPNSSAFTDKVNVVDIVNEKHNVDISSDDEKRCIEYYRHRFIEEANVPESFFLNWITETPSKTETESIIKDYGYFRLKSHIKMHFENWINKMMDAEAKKQGIDIKGKIKLHWKEYNS